jgi:hypothetical protein
MAVSALIPEASKVFDQNAVDAVGDILEPVNDLLQMAINLRSDNESPSRCPCDVSETVT